MIIGENLWLNAEIMVAFHYFWAWHSKLWASSLAVRALAYCAKDHGLGPT